jgi:hypothetical protein
LVSRIRIGSSFIPDPDPANKRREKLNELFSCRNRSKLKSNFKQNLIFPVFRHFYRKNLEDILNLGRGMDPGSGKKSSRIPDPWGKNTPDPRSGSATLR